MLLCQPLFFMPTKQVKNSMTSKYSMSHNAIAQVKEAACCYTGCCGVLIIKQHQLLWCENFFFKYIL